jgi:hypothetical protein
MLRYVYIACIVDFTFIKTCLYTVPPSVILSRQETKYHTRNVYVVQLDTQCSFMVEFIHNICQLYIVSGPIGPSSGASFKAV